MDRVSLSVGMDWFAVNFIARFANHFDEEVAVLDQMFVAETKCNPFWRGRSRAGPWEIPVPLCL